MNPKVKKGLKITGNVLFWIFFALALSMTIFAFTSRASATGAPQFGNKVLLTVESESMTGTFDKGDLIVCEVRDENQVVDYEVGDVITFVYNGPETEYENKVISHTIVGKYGSGVDAKYTTQGDNKATNPRPEQVPTSLDNIKAKWTGKRIPVLGSIIGFLQSTIGFLVCVVIPLALFFIYEVVQLILIIRDMRGKKTMKNISKEQEEMIKQKAIEEFLKKQAEEAKNKNPENPGDKK